MTRGSANQMAQAKCRRSYMGVLYRHTTPVSPLQP